MARATPPAVGAKGASQEWPKDINADYVSKTDPNAQTIVSDVTFTGAVTIGGAGEATVSSGGTIAHGLSGTPSWVSLTPKALQPYVVSYNADATNITVYHNKVGKLTVGWRAGV